MNHVDYRLESIFGKVALDCVPYRAWTTLMCNSGDCYLTFDIMVQRWPVGIPMAVTKDNTAIGLLADRKAQGISATEVEESRWLLVVGEALVGAYPKLSV